ncbi:hypothetical protein RhiirA5_396810 [Rhizophagus irregularis]|uniref:Uncharacterized protein n=3 Tax=Rhizophagus irregularis TaxID=588596 RepID=U9TLI3_RHIID|nr:hypothetical protein GLOIN_2v1538026 [Rhizophagus irregularis DAOM 181602=DAOM 197198]EXX76021.1 hypothetical protein RirG_036900 [Rhizophagus irregularis DAOM 197198w]PKC12617.1 hypothetical protein RhiirA5_396810 [Rhizophagus irregularis]PKC68069.1 hypothetical protein RhiirA1_534459 [Rhizophagus irregularis]PKY19913.1 hypothetical protein RhiirB3_469451 [Rhizophagus irregularis]POG78301.1 hypothetical protein GLOIN_2v1538026 [Rhizophagus irregularis DAOM 181602=DAOM 197198]|eukprot:XP_025185167.1 hypothetical protein GLOIN_2v1538026 [Rhizophagus irregularis DAOM 181602=DAOM 197198]
MSSSISSPITYINTSVSNESIPSISESPIVPKHRVDKPLIIVTKTDIPAQETKKEEVSDKGCAKVCRYILIRSKRVFEILTYFRLVVAIALNILIIIDLISIRQKKANLFWMEVLTQVINAEFTLLTIISHPKRIINLPRAIKIYIASRKIPYQQNELFTPNIKETQKNVYKNYDWYLYEATRADLICSPGKLLVILLIWNLGSLAQYGICVILWFFPQQERPLEIYAILIAIVLTCEILPIPLVVKQYKKVIIAKGEK